MSRRGGTQRGDGKEKYLWRMGVQRGGAELSPVASFTANVVWCLSGTGLWGLHDLTRKGRHENYLAISHNNFVNSLPG